METDIFYLLKINYSPFPLLLSFLGHHFLSTLFQLRLLAGLLSSLCSVFCFFHRVARELFLTANLITLFFIYENNISDFLIALSITYKAFL